MQPFPSRHNMFECERLLGRTLQVIQHSVDLGEATAWYQQAREATASALKLPEIEQGAGRRLMAKLLCVHLAYRTKEADATGCTRLLCVR